MTDEYDGSDDKREDDIRSNWTIDTEVSVYSNSERSWVPARISKLNEGGDFVTVIYYDDDNSTKEVNKYRRNRIQQRWVNTENLSRQLKKDDTTRRRWVKNSDVEIFISKNWHLAKITNVPEKRNGIDLKKQFVEVKIESPEYEGC